MPHPPDWWLSMSSTSSLSPQQSVFACHLLRLPRNQQAAILSSKRWQEILQNKITNGNPLVPLQKETQGM